MATNKKTIIYFDGVCNLCNGFVDFLISRVDHRTVAFASLQGQTAQEQLPQQIRHTLESVVVQRQDTIVTHSQAILSILGAMTGWWPTLARFLSLFPISLLDACYRLLARHRYRLFGKRKTCRLPSDQERLYFLP